MISINKLSIAFNGITLLNDISFTVSKGDKIGLTGKNGAGKSTLLKIISGLQAYDTGTISMPGDSTTGYLPQQMKYPDGKTVIEETMSAFSDILSIRNEIEKLHQQMVDFVDYESEAYAATLQKLQEKEDLFNHLGGHNLRANVEKTLKGLGFSGQDFDRDVSEFSGGWRMRIELAKILLKKPDLLLLDEPTNHLDIESIIWLEQMLMTYSGSVIIISHDRLFLDNVTKRTIEIVKGRIYDYKVPFSRFETLRKERIEQLTAAYKNQQKMIIETEQFIERFRYKATKAVQVQSRIKQLEKIERIEIDESDRSELKFYFPEAPRSGDVVFELEEVTKAYTLKPVLKHLWLTIERGQKIAFIGKNGEGKTTLVRILKGELEFEGRMKTGHLVKIGYFAQNQDKELDDTKTVFDTLDDIAKGDVRLRLRDILGSFLFSGEDIEKKVEVLSGGERSRLALAKLMLEHNNVLILDEPTNHLDIHSKEMLKQALKVFEGTLIIVSHDRFFLDGLVDEIYEFKDQGIKKHSGDIQAFLDKKKIESGFLLSDSETTNVVEKAELVQNDQKDLYVKRKEIDKEIRKLTKQLEETETDIHRIESLMKDSEAKMIEGNIDDHADFYRAYEELKILLDRKMGVWDELSEGIESFIKQKDRLK